MPITNEFKKALLNLTFRNKKVERYRNGEVQITIVKMRPLTVKIKIDCDYAYCDVGTIVLEKNKTLRIPTKIEVRMVDS